MLTVHLRIVDAATKQPLPSRLRVTDSAGNYYAPLGRLPVFACGPGEDVGGSVRLGKENFAFIDGGCEIALPAGVPLRVRAFHGPEWTPLDRTVTLGSGQLTLRFEMTRWFDRGAEGLSSSDTRAHFISPHAALLEAAAEDLDEVHLLAHSHYFLAHDGNTYPALPNLTAFSGQSPAVTAGGRAVFVNTLNTHPMLGTLGLLLSHRPVFPLAFGGAEGSDDWSLCDWADQCHRKRGRVVWHDAFREGLPGGEALVALILGKVDAIAFDAMPRSTPFLPRLYQLWNAGYHVPLAGGSGKDSNRMPLGAVRGYSPVSIEGVRLTPFVTNGPLLRFRVDGTRLVATAESVTAFDKLELLANGQVVATTAATAGDRHTAEVTVEHSTPGWVAARAVGGASSALFPEQPAFAHTSAVVLGSPAPDPTAVAGLRGCVERTREWVETRGEFTAEKAKGHHLERCAAALATLAGAGQ